jgi:hypothetical protein
MSVSSDLSLISDMALRLSLDSAAYPLDKELPIEVESRLQAFIWKLSIVVSELERADLSRGEHRRTLRNGWGTITETNPIGASWLSDVDVVETTWDDFRTVYLRQRKLDEVTGWGHHEV